GNIGDLAIAIAEKKFIEDNLPQCEYIEIEYNEEFEKIKKSISTDDVILLTGGGNLGDEYMYYEERRRRVIEAFPNNKIIIMPQTVYFNDTEKGRQELEKTRKIYSSHKYLTVVTREKVSFNTMKREFPNVNTILTPDIVMYLKETKDEKRNGAIMAMRDDKEKTLNIEDVEMIKSKLLKKFNNITMTDTHLGEGLYLNQEMREKAFFEKLDEFRKAELVITDRLHGMIFAAITSTPCIALGNYNYKIESSFDWLKDQNYIKFLNNINDIEDAIIELTSKNNYRYNNDFALKEYKKILDVINN
ncbi:MAG: general stress protein, partial [Clostridia bacterium]|nr:general stress protein [Clostridia bacterium]